MAAAPIAVAFDLDGAHLWSSSYVADKPVLAKVRLGRDTQAEDVPLPPLTEDAVAHIAQNPARRSEIAIATFKRSVFVSPDQGLTWTQLARDGTGRQ